MCQTHLLDNIVVVYVTLTPVEAAIHHTVLLCATVCKLQGLHKAIKLISLTCLAEGRAQALHPAQSWEGLLLHLLAAHSIKDDRPQGIVWQGVQHPVEPELKPEGCWNPR